MKKFLTLSMLTVLVLVGCNKATAPISNIPATNGVVADIPKECPKESSVAVKSGVIDMIVGANNSWYIEAHPLADEDGTFFFTNYSIDNQGAWGHTNVGKEAKAYFSIGTKDKAPVTNGVWDQSIKDANNKLTAINISGATSNRFTGGEKNKVEITYFGGDYVCGNVSIDDGDDSIKGDFIAKYSKWKSLFD